MPRKALTGAPRTITTQRGADTSRLHAFSGILTLRGAAKARDARFARLPSTSCGTVVSIAPGGSSQRRLWLARSPLMSSSADRFRADRDGCETVIGKAIAGPDRAGKARRRGLRGCRPDGCDNKASWRIFD